jgi:hypothetical protein
MDTKEMIEVMKAFEDGKTIEARRNGTVTTTVCTRDWSECPTPVWDWLNVEYRIAPEPKKEGRWERVEVILTGDSLYMFRCPHQANVLVSLPNAARYPGFGGIDYRSPFDEKVIIRSMVPLMFKSGTQNYVTAGDSYDEEIMIFDPADRPGIPVAAWFWREE